MKASFQQLPHLEKCPSPPPQVQEVQQRKIKGEKKAQDRLL